MVTIRPATAGDAEAVGKLMAEAFSNDPAWWMYYSDPADLVPKVAAHYRRKVQRHPELGDIALDDGEVVGALLYERPRTSTPVTTMIDRCSRFFRGVAARLPGQRGRAHSLAVEQKRPAEPHWYLDAITASAQARGKGVGSALLTHRLAIIDGEGQPRRGPNESAVLTALEATTSNSRRLYERFGFEAVAQVPSKPGHASTVMVRGK